MATRASSLAVLIGERCCTPSRWLFWSMNPPVPGVDASRKVSGDAHSALPVVLMTWSSVTPERAEPLRVDEDLELALLLTPDHDVGRPRARRSARGTIVQRASTPSWIGVSSSEERLIIIARLVDGLRLQHGRDLGDVRAARAPR